MTRLLLVLALIGLSAGTTNAQTSGICGDSLTWSLTGTESDLTLTISGTGSMYNYGDNAPWRSQRKKIKTLVLHNGMISIGNCAFGLCESVTSITMPNSVKTIGRGAFSFCTSLTSITISTSLMEIGADAFAMSGHFSDIYVSWTTPPPQISKIIRHANREKATLHIPQGTLNAYQTKIYGKHLTIVEDVPNTE